MLIEMLIWASCNAAGAALGGCDQDCPTQGAGSYTICQVEKTESNTKKPVATAPKPKPKRLCSYYVNGTIDIPTVSVISAWVEVGSRLCIGDEVPKPQTAKPKTLVEEITDAFTAYATKPFAFLSPGGEVEVGESVNFGVDLGGGSHTGELFGRSAEIRFWPTDVRWHFSDGQSLSGRNVSAQFAEPQQLRASATVYYRIDYRYPGSSWVIGASSANLDSNQLVLSVIDPPRRTLLRD